jgi:hypothetical protein
MAAEEIYNKIEYQPENQPNIGRAENRLTDSGTSQKNTLPLTTHAGDRDASRK